MDKVVNNYCSMTFRQQLRDLHEQWKQVTISHFVNNLYYYAEVTNDEILFC